MKKNQIHFVIVGVLVVVATVVVQQLLNILFALPPQASEEALVIDSVFGLLWWLVAFLFSIICVFILYSVVVFRRKPGDNSDGAHIHGNVPLEIAWTFGPLIFVLYFGWLGTTTFMDITKEEVGEETISVIGRQWSWTFEYPEEDGLKTTEMALEVNQPVVLEMEAEDVIHSFWVPEFRVKQDLLPGRKTYLRFTPTEVGEYKVRCAEMCGLSHAYMLAPVQVLSSADYQLWIEEQKAGGGGRKVAELNGCIGCHSVDGSPLVGPTWLNLYNKTETLADGSTIIVDEDYLRESITCPNCSMVSGFNEGLMPANFEQTLTAEEIDLLIEYIISLSE